MANWSDVFDYQTALWKFWQTPEARLFAESYSESLLERLGPPVPSGDFIVRSQIMTMGQAEPVYVSPQMMPLVEAAVPEFQPEVLLPSDLPSPSGFLMLPKPLISEDGRGRFVSWRALGWSPCSSETGTNQIMLSKWADLGVENFGIYLTLYSHLDDPDEDLASRIPDKELADRIFSSRLALLHAMPIFFNDEGFKRRLSLRDQGSEAVIQAHAVLRLMMQRISQRYRYANQRATRRRAMKLGMPKHDRQVTVITLRRPRDNKKPEEPGNVEWSHQWIVGGHWRNQWFPSIQQHRQIYISPYVKGPEDKPLRIREMRAWEWRV